MQEFIIRFLAQAFEAFKLKSPVAAAVVQVGLGVVLYAATHAEQVGLFMLPDWAKAAASVVSALLLALTGSQTFRYLPEDQQAKARPGAATK